MVNFHFKMLCIYSNYAEDMTCNKTLYIWEHFYLNSCFSDWKNLLGRIKQEICGCSGHEFYMQSIMQWEWYLLDSLYYLVLLFRVECEWVESLFIFFLIVRCGKQVRCGYWKNWMVAWWETVVIDRGGWTTQEVSLY